MTALLAILAKAWPFLVAAAGIAFGWIRHQQAKTATAVAGQQVAQAQIAAAQVQASAAQSNAEAAQASATAIKEKTDVQNATAALPAGAAAVELRTDWSRD